MTIYIYISMNGGIRKKKDNKNHQAFNLIKLIKN